MKFIGIIVAILFSNIMLNAQVATNTELKDSSNIYYQAFKIYCKQKSEKTDILLVEENNLTTKSLPASYEGQKIKIINAVELQDLLKKKKQIQLIRIVPLRIKEGCFFVNIVVFNVVGKRKQFNFINMGGISVVYNYNVDLKSFIFKEIR